VDLRRAFMFCATPATAANLWMGIGERDGTRTHDLAIKSRVLYQLSYALVTKRLIFSENSCKRSGIKRPRAV
jgi:hypothetical protein